MRSAFATLAASLTTLAAGLATLAALRTLTMLTALAALPALAAGLARKHLDRLRKTLQAPRISACCAPSNERNAGLNVTACTAQSCHWNPQQNSP
jgi:hypothetical protein